MELWEKILNEHAERVAALMASGIYKGDCYFCISQKQFRIVRFHAAAVNEGKMFVFKTHTAHYRFTITRNEKVQGGKYAYTVHAEERKD